MHWEVHLVSIRSEEMCGDQVFASTHIITQKTYSVLKPSTAFIPEF